MSNIEPEVIWEPKAPSSIKEGAVQEPYVQFLGHYRICLSEIRRILDGLNNYIKNRDIPDYGKLGVDENSDNCEFCGEYDRGLIFYDSKRTNFICTSCIIELRDSLESIDENTYAAYSKGLFIRNVNKIDIGLPDKFEDNDIVIAIGNGKRKKIIDEESLFVFYKACNFDLFKNDLNNYNTYNGEFLRDCSFCGENILCGSGATLPRREDKSLQCFHPKCFEKIATKVEDFETKYKKEILSRNI